MAKFTKNYKRREIINWFDIFTAYKIIYFKQGESDFELKSNRRMLWKKYLFFFMYFPRYEHYYIRDIIAS